jgi:hypothetical protein
MTELPANWRGSNEPRLRHQRVIAYRMARWRHDQFNEDIDEAWEHILTLLENNQLEGWEMDHNGYSKPKPERDTRSRKQIAEEELARWLTQNIPAEKRWQFFSLWRDATREGD